MSFFGLQTIVGMPASLAYSKAGRMVASSLPGAMLPQLSGVIPASRNFFATGLDVPPSCS